MSAYEHVQPVDVLVVDTREVGSSANLPGPPMASPPIDIRSYRLDHNRFDSTVKPRTWRRAAWLVVHFGFGIDVTAGWLHGQ